MVLRRLTIFSLSPVRHLGKLRAFGHLGKLMVFDKLTDFPYGGAVAIDSSPKLRSQKHNTPRHLARGGDQAPISRSKQWISGGGEAVLWTADILDLPKVGDENASPRVVFEPCGPTQLLQTC
jgi:hypothetical protein